jgi:hypothetical protein
MESMGGVETRVQSVWRCGRWLSRRRFRHCQGPKSTTDQRRLVSPSFAVRIPTIGYWLQSPRNKRLFTTVTRQRLLDYTHEDNCK